MTPEEQWIQIRNALHSIAENQARHDAMIERNSAQIEKNSKQIERNSTQIEKNTVQIEKNAAGIRDLIVVGRTVLNSIEGLTKAQKEVTASIHELREAQSDTEGKLNALIDTVDRIVTREQGGPPMNPRP
jgi:chromosome segregation ATPase